jgi:hypothetical protein
MTSTMTIAREADAVASIRQTKACHVRAWRLKWIAISNWIMKGSNCPANQQPHAPYYYSTTIHATTLICYTLTSYQYHILSIIISRIHSGIRTRRRRRTLTSVRPATSQQSTTTSEQTVKSTSTMEEVSLLLTNPSRTHRLNQPLTLNVFLRPLPVIHPRYYGLFYKH